MNDLKFDRDSRQPNRLSTYLDREFSQLSSLCREPDNQYRWFREPECLDNQTECVDNSKFLKVSSDSCVKKFFKAHLKVFKKSIRKRGNTFLKLLLSAKKISLKLFVRFPVNSVKFLKHFFDVQSLFSRLTYSLLIARSVSLEYL